MTIHDILRLLTLQGVCGGSVLPLMTDDLGSSLLRTLSAVLGTSLLTVFHWSGVQRAAHNVIAYARQVLNATAAHQHNAVLLEVVSFATDVRDDLLAVGQANPGYLTESGVRLLGRLGFDLEANTTTLRARIKSRGLCPGCFRRPRLTNQLINCGHYCFRFAELAKAIIMRGLRFCANGLLEKVMRARRVEISFYGLGEQFGKVAQSKVLQKGTGCGKESRFSWLIGSTGDLNQASFHQRSNGVAAIDSPDGLHLGAGHWLPIGYDGQNLEQAGGETVALATRAAARQEWG